jgi:5,10-methenyltetrahydromethanopterin hydrogenase
MLVRVLVGVLFAGFVHIVLARRVCRLTDNAVYSVSKAFVVAVGVTLNVDLAHLARLTNIAVWEALFHTLNATNVVTITDDSTVEATAASSTNSVNRNVGSVVTSVVTTCCKYQRGYSYP